MSLDTFIFFLETQHVSGINMPIFRSLWLCCWTTTLAVTFLVCCVLELGWGSARPVSGLPAEAQLFSYHNDARSNKHQALLWCPFCRWWGLKGCTFLPILWPHGLYMPWLQTAVVAGRSGANWQASMQTTGSHHWTCSLPQHHLLGYHRYYSGICLSGIQSTLPQTQVRFLPHYYCYWNCPSSRTYQGLNH